MKLNENQKLVLELSMKLDLKTREYGLLSERLNEYKESNLDHDSEEYKSLLESFRKNNKEIKEIKHLLENACK